MEHKLEETNLVAVYGTLKRAHSNHWAMERAKGVFLKEDYIPFTEMDWVWFPRCKFENEHSKNMLKVEIFEVSKEWVLGPLDSLEWYPSHYTRKQVTSIDGTSVTVYEIRSSITDKKEEWLQEATPSDGWLKFYEWTK